MFTMMTKSGQSEFSNENKITRRFSVCLTRRTSKPVSNFFFSISAIHDDFWLFLCLCVCVSLARWIWHSWPMYQRSNAQRFGKTFANSKRVKQFIFLFFFVLLLLRRFISCRRSDICLRLHSTIYEKFYYLKRIALPFQWEYRELIGCGCRWSYFTRKFFHLKMIRNDVRKLLLSFPFEVYFLLTFDTFKWTIGEKKTETNRRIDGDTCSRRYECVRGMCVSQRQTSWTKCVAIFWFRLSSVVTLAVVVTRSRRHSSMIYRFIFGRSQRWAAQHAILKRSNYSIKT